MVNMYRMCVLVTNSHESDKHFKNKLGKKYKDGVRVAQVFQGNLLFSSLDYHFHRLFGDKKIYLVTRRVVGVTKIDIGLAIYEF